MAPAVPTSDTLEQAVTELSTATAQLLRRMRSEAGPNEVGGLSQLSIISRLGEAGSLATAELARLESMTPQSMGAILAQMEGDQLVERRRHPTDGRQILFALTPAGVEARRKRGLAKRAWMLAAISTLTPAEQKTLIAATAVLRRIAES